VPPPNQDDVPDVPAIPVFQREDEFGRTRALTASTTSTATPPKLEEGSGFDMGGDFGSMFSRFDKRASTVTLKNEPPPGSLANGQRQAHPAPLTLDMTSQVEPPAASWDSHHSRDNLMGAASPPMEYDRPPPVPRHQPSFEYRASASPEGIVEDEDARLLADSVLAGRFLTDAPRNDIQAGRYRRDTDQFSAAKRNPVNSEFEKEDNMFEGTTQRFSKPSHMITPRSATNDSNKVMTPAEFERYRMDKEREGLHKAANPSVNHDDDEDEINYDDEEDEEDKLKQQAKQRRNQQASMAAYRQKNMKTTGELRSTSPLPPARAGLPTSLSAPHLGQAKTPSPEPVHPANDDDDDEDIPLGILQAHGFPNKNRQPGQLTSYGSNPNLRASTFLSPGRPASTLGEPPSGPAKRHSTLPAFARNLPQDPFVGASIARPAMRESLAMGGGSQTHLSPVPQQQAPMQPGGLVGVIANEERSRAMRRGSPNMETQKLMNGGNVDPLSGIPPHMMYSGGGHLGMAGGTNGQQRPQQQMSVTDQAQLQMNQQMQQFMQMQMQFMQMMAANQQGPQQQMPPQIPPHMLPQQQYPAFAPSPSVVDFSSGQSVVGVPTNQPRRLDPSMRTMSMIQPNTTSSFLQGGPGFAQGPPAGYTPSIAPSERSNVGLPNRYRPVSHAGSMAGQMMHTRSQSMSGALTLSQVEDLKAKPTPTVKLVHSAKNQSNSDDDDEEGWESMRATRDQKKSKWRFKKRSEDIH
jgi:hypothetical protein